MTITASPLALFGGPKAVEAKTYDPVELFRWPIITPEIEDAVLGVLRAGTMSEIEITREFEKEFAAWHGMSFALAHNTGTAAIHGAFYGLGIGAGDEVICPSLTYWASCLQVYSLGATVVFADIDPETLCIDPGDIEHRIGPRTRAIVVVHYAGRPADMDAILAIAARHHLAVLEDGSHAHGALYKGRMVGTLGDVAGFSLMTGKSFATGEGGILLTNDRRIYERAVLFGHYERAGDVTLPDLAAGAGLPWGGYKYRMHQLTSAVARIQVRNYPGQMAEIDRAMNYFWDQLEGVPGLGSRRPPADANTTMGGWYYPIALYRPEELGGLSVTALCRALQAEGVPCSPGANRPLHLHPLFNTIDVYHAGRPTRIAHLSSEEEIQQERGSLPHAEAVQAHAFAIPWFKHCWEDAIDEYAAAVRKVIENYRALLPGDPGNPPDDGRWGLSRRRTTGEPGAQQAAKA